MSSGSEIPYHLRPNKFIDRELFVELLSRTLPFWGTESYCYFSMGGRHLVDHHSVYRRLGVKHLHAIDFDSEVVNRQVFNAPTQTAKCVVMDAAKLASDFGDLIEASHDYSRGIIWLDYTQPKDRRSQLDAFATVARQLQPGDIARITLNANVRSLAAEQVWKDSGSELSLSGYRAEKLRNQLGNFVPSAVKEVEKEDFPSVLLHCIKHCLETAVPTASATKIIPVLNTVYNDGTVMLTSTVLCVEPDAKLPSGLSEWEYLANDWTSPFEIVAPDLSLRERFFLDERLQMDPGDILAEAKFLSGKPQHKDQSIRAITSYKKLHRFYPTFRNTET